MGEAGVPGIIARLATKDHKEHNQASFLMCSLCVFS